MAHRYPLLNDRQFAVLRWIANGCTDGVMEGSTHKTHAIALQNRFLVTIRRRRGTWSAELTESGQYYLTHGHYQADPVVEVVPGAGPSYSRSGAPEPDLAVRTSQRISTKRKRLVPKPRIVHKQEVYMRYRVLVTRVQVAERWVRATDEENAAQKVQAEFDKPFGYFGVWETTTSEVEVVEAEQTVAIKLNPLSPEGPLLLSLKDASRALGVSYSMLYELTNKGDIEHTMVGSRRYIARDALLRFIEQHTHRGYNR